MELLCNLGWLAVTIAFWGFWCVQERQRKRRSKRQLQLPAIAVQLISLCALTAILLPVISITDDLQASNNPAEVERSAVKRNQFLNLHHVSHGVPDAIAYIVPGPQPALMRRLAILPVNFTVTAKGSAHLIAPWSRPPPVA
jgi:hypothetical protein